MRQAAIAVLWLLATACGTNPHTQPQECRNLLACDRGRDGGQGDPRIGSNGSCWYAPLAVADSCTATCLADLKAYAASHPDAGCRLESWW